MFGSWNVGLQNLTCQTILSRKNLKALNIPRQSRLDCSVSSNYKCIPKLLWIFVRKNIGQPPPQGSVEDLDLLKCFTTTFLHTHSWLNWVDVDDWWEWGWKKSQKLLDTSKWDPKYRECGQTKNWIPNLCHYWELQTRGWVGSSLPKGPWERMKSIPRGIIYHRSVGCIEPGFFTPFMPGIINNGPGPTKSPFTTCMVRGVYYYPDPFTRIKLHILYKNKSIRTIWIIG